eukprot:1160701-Rhodomonas_salina.1
MRVGSGWARHARRGRRRILCAWAALGALSPRALVPRVADAVVPIRTPRRRYCARNARLANEAPKLILVLPDSAFRTWSRPVCRLELTKLASRARCPVRAI